MVVLLPSDSNPTDAVEDLTSTLKSDLPSDVKDWVTGPAGYTADLSDAFSGIDGLLLFVTVAAVCSGLACRRRPRAKLTPRHQCGRGSRKLCRAARGSWLWEYRSCWPPAV